MNIWDLYMNKLTANRSQSLDIIPSRQLNPTRPHFVGCSLNTELQRQNVLRTNRAHGTEYYLFAWYIHAHLMTRWWYVCGRCKPWRKCQQWRDGLRWTMLWAYKHINNNLAVSNITCSLSTCQQLLERCMKAVPSLFAIKKMRIAR